jgi:hypothetical protein
MRQAIILMREAIMLMRQAIILMREASLVCACRRSTELPDRLDGPRRRFTPTSLHTTVEPRRLSSTGRCRRPSASHHPNGGFVSPPAARFVSPPAAGFVSPPAAGFVSKPAAAATPAELSQTPPLLLRRWAPAWAFTPPLRSRQERSRCRPTQALAYSHRRARSHLAQSHRRA